MKHEKKKKIALTFGLILCLLLFIAGITGKIGTQEQQVPENPVHGVDQDRSQVLYRGEGYDTLAADNREAGADVLPETEVVSEERTEVSPTPEPEKDDSGETQENTEESIQEIFESGKSNPVPQENQEFSSENNESGKKPADSNGDKKENSKPVIKKFDDTSLEIADHEESGDDDNNQEEADIPQDTPVPTPEVQDLRPSISSDLQDGEVIHKESRVFSVYAEDYKERTLTPSQLTVTCNGEKLSSISTDNGVIKYKAYLQDENNISITAQDRYGNSDTVSVTIYKEITGDEEEEQPAGTITFSLEASTLGLGYLIGPVSVPFYEEETLPYVFNRVLYSYGFQYHYTGSMDAGFYVKSIDRPGITDGYQIPDALLQHLNDVNDIPDPETCSSDWLGEGTLTGGSGWMFSVNGTYLSTGMNTYFPADGDEVRIRFTLYYGADIGESMLGGETWGDW